MKVSKKAVTQIILLIINILFATLSAHGVVTGNLDPGVLAVAIVGAVYQIIVPIITTWRNTPITEPAKKAQALIKAGKKGFETLSSEERLAVSELYEEVKEYYSTDDIVADTGASVKPDPTIEGAEGLEV
jgi:hypothetical protein